MKPVTSTETITVSEDKVRKSLHELQPSANDKETLVGADRMIKSTQQAQEVKSKKNVPTKMKKTSKKEKKVTTNDKAVQTVREEKIEIEAEDLTCTNLAGPSENYWKIIAEKRQIALKNALKENKELAERIKNLEEENRICKEMLNETRALVEVMQDIIEDKQSEDDRNDNMINNSLDDSVL